MEVTLTPSQRKSAIILTLASIYLVAGKFGLGLAFVNPSATAVWAPTGIALVALLLLGYEVWPGIFLGAFLVNLTTSNAPVASFFIATGNTLEALVGCYLMTRFANGKAAFNSAWTIFRFAFFTTLVSTVISASIGATSLCVAGLAPWPQFSPVFLTWWLGDTTGALIVSPVLLLWYANHKVEWSLPKTVEAIMLLASIVGIGQTVFGGIMPTSIKN